MGLLIHLSNSPALYALVDLAALLVMLRGVAQLVWTAETRSFPQVLPNGFQFEWTDLSYQQLHEGRKPLLPLP